jgi:hypothetical protein
MSRTDSATRTGLPLDAGVVDACLAPALTPTGATP